MADVMIVRAARECQCPIRQKKKAGDVMIVVGKCHRIDDGARDANIIKNESRCGTDERRSEAGEFSRMGATASERGFERGGTAGVEAVDHSLSGGLEGAGTSGVPGECAGVLAGAKEGGCKESGGARRGAGLVLRAGGAFGRGEAGGAAGNGVAGTRAFPNGETV